jgi:hypothetical protein
VARTHADGLNVQDASSNTPFIGWLDSTSARLGFLQVGGTDLTLRNEIHGGPVKIQGEDNAGVVRTLLAGDPDTGSVLYHAGLNKAGTITTGFFATGSTSLGIGGSQNAEFRLYQADATTIVARLGFLNSAAMFLRNVNHGGSVVIDAEDVGGTVRTILDADPDGITTLRGDTDIRLQNAAGETALYATANNNVSLYYDNVSTARTQAAASGGFQANNTLTGSGFERVLTVSDAPVLDFLSADVSETTTTLQNALSAFSLDASSEYIVEFGLDLTSNDLAQAPNAAIRFDYSSTFVSAGRGLLQYMDNAGTVDALQIRPDVTFNTLDVATISSPVTGSFGISTTGAGTLQFQFAVGSGSSGSPEITLERNSWIRVTRVN